MLRSRSDNHTYSQQSLETENVSYIFVVFQIDFPPNYIVMLSMVFDPISNVNLAHFKLLSVLAVFPTRMSSPYSTPPFEYNFKKSL